MRVLIVEDEAFIGELLDEIISTAGFEVCGVARTGHKALTLADEQRPELAIVDVCLAGGDRGTDLAPILMSRYNTGILYSTGDLGPMGDADGHAFLTKPFRLALVPLALNVVMTMIGTGKIPPIPPELTSALTILRRANQLSS
jgi:DNA-binding response OmpR family regulator